MCSRIALSSVLLFFSFSLFAQLKEADLVFFRKQEDTLRKIASKLFKLKNDSLKFVQNKEFSEKWESVLLNQKAFDYPFDSLRRDVGVLVSPDDKFRIINWDLLLRDGTHRYYGFVQVRDAKSGSYELFELNDVSETVKSAETHSADNTKWYGMLYYKIVPCDGYYVLLGLDEADRTVTRKIVDVISFKPDNTPIFGKNVFNNIPKKYPRRLLFEYSAQSTIIVDYEADENRIVFNHVGPPDPFLEGQYQYYIPDGSFDCLIYRKNAWNFKPDCDARNDKSRLDNAKPPKDKEKPIFVPN